MFAFLKKTTAAFAAIGFAIGLTACDSTQISGPDTFDRASDSYQQHQKEGSIFVEDGISFGGSEEKRKQQGAAMSDFNNQPGGNQVF